MTPELLKEAFKKIDIGYPTALTAREYKLSEPTLRRWYNQGYEATVKQKFTTCRKCETPIFKENSNHLFCEYCCVKQAPRPTKADKKEAKLREVRLKIKEIFNK